MNQILFGGCPFCGKQTCIAGQCNIQKEIKLKREAIDAQLASLAEQCKELQSTCTHPNASHVNKANTGNYDPSCDSYWTDHHCTDCGKYWQTDQYWDRKRTIFNN